jgi:hypothetical protein
MHRALPPSEPPDGEHPRCLRLAAVGGARPRGGWHPLAIAWLQGFSSGSPATFPHQWSPRVVTISSMVGRSKPGCDLCPPSASRIFIILAREEGGASRGLPPRGPVTRFFLRHLGEEDILQLCGGGVLQPCGGRRTAAAWTGCSIPSFVWATVAGCTEGSHNTSYAMRAVLVFWDGPVLVLVSRTGVRTCRCALGRPPLAGAMLVGRWPLSLVLRWWQPEKVSPPTTLSVPPALRASGSLALMAGSRPLRGDVNEGLPAVAFALGPSLLLSCRPRRRSLSRCWCSGRRRATRSLSSCRPSDVEVVHTRGSGTGVLFVMAP